MSLSKTENARLQQRRNGIVFCKDRLPYKTVTMYETPDGKQHRQADRAENHAAEVAAAELTALMRAKPYFDGRVSEFQVLKFVMENHAALVPLLAKLQAFEKDDHDA